MISALRTTKPSPRLSLRDAGSRFASIAYPQKPYPPPAPESHPLPTSGPRVFPVPSPPAADHEAPSEHRGYQQPSVTWGVILGRKEKMVANVMICSYLKRLGIVTDELEDIELPSTVAVMEERMELLKKLGLTIDDMNEYPLMLGCSVRKNIIPVLCYLEKIGIPRPELGEFVKRYPQVLHSSVIHDLFPVVKLLGGLDVDHHNIGYVIGKYPELLGFKVEGTMNTTVAYLVGIGVSPRDISHMIVDFPWFLGMRVGTVIKPLVDYLVSLGLPKMLLARLLEKRPRIMSYDLEHTVKPNVGYLISFGVRQEALPSVIAQYPAIIGLPLKSKLASLQYYFSLKLSMEPECFAQAVERMPQIVCLHKHLIVERVQFFLDRGLSPPDVARMIARCPQIVLQRLESLKRAYYFFKTEIRRPATELVEFPEYFTYSLGERIKPRFERLRRERMMRSLGWFLNCSDLAFEHRVRGCGGVGEAQIAGPLFCMGGKQELPEVVVVSDEEDESEDETVYRRTVSL